MLIQTKTLFLPADVAHSCYRRPSKPGLYCSVKTNNYLIHFSESKPSTPSKDTQPQQNLDDLTVLKSLADGQEPKKITEVPLKKDDQYVPDESDSTKSRRLAEDYDSTKNGMDDGKYQGKSWWGHFFMLRDSVCRWQAIQERAGDYT